MKHLFIPYELAVIAKEKGFNEDCFKFFGDGNLFNHEGKFNYTHELNNNRSGIKEFLLAPLYQQIVDWLEEKYGLFFERLMNEDIGVYYIVWNDTAAYSELKTIDKAIEEAFSFIKPISATEA